MIKNQSYLMHRKKQDRMIDDYRGSMEYVNHKESKLLNDNDTYGIQTPFDEYGSQKLQYQWKTHQNSSSRQANVDFKKVNKHYMSVEDRKNLINQQQNLEDIQKGNRHYEIYIPEYGHMYGLLNKPSTPIQKVLGGKYGNDFNSRQTQINTYYLQQMKQNQGQKQMSIPIKSTHASKLFKQQQSRTSQTIEKDKPLFKMNKFRNVGSVLNSNMNSKMQSQLNFNTKTLQTKSQYHE